MGIFFDLNSSYASIITKFRIKNNNYAASICKKKARAEREGERED